MHIAVEFENVQQALKSSNNKDNIESTIPNIDEII